MIDAQLKMRVGVTDVDQLWWYRKIESMKLSELIAKLTTRTPGNRAMEIGIAWHNVLEKASHGVIDSTECNGIKFVIKNDLSMSLQPIREIFGSEVFVIDGIKVTLTGKIDAMNGTIIHDHKVSTKAFNPESYFDSFQWRAYLMLFGATQFVYESWHIRDKKDHIEVLNHGCWNLHTYEGMKDDFMAALTDYVRFCKAQVPQLITNIGEPHFKARRVTNDVELPVNYERLTPAERKAVREQYIKVQNGKCAHCDAPLDGPPLPDIQNAYIDEKLFPKGFFDWPVHLHHNHDTGMTCGALHARCNAWLWQYAGE